ncbi:unnamed protein product, partial [marine sediment metagenome]
MKTDSAVVKDAVTSKKVASDKLLLKVEDVSMRFGVLAVLKGVSFSVPKGNILVIIGPNGAGKSTLLKLISGLLSLQEGEIWFKRHRLSKIPPHRISSLGITQLFQDVQLFSSMSVIENVMVGCHLLI